MSINNEAVEAAAEALKPLFVSAGLIGLVADAIAWDAARVALSAALPHLPASTVEQ